MPQPKTAHYKRKPGARALRLAKMLGPLVAVILILSDPVQAIEDATFTTPLGTNSMQQFYDMIDQIERETGTKIEGEEFEKFKRRFFEAEKPLTGQVQVSCEPAGLCGQ